MKQDFFLIKISCKTTTIRKSTAWFKIKIPNADIINQKKKKEYHIINQKEKYHRVNSKNREYWLVDNNSELWLDVRVTFWVRKLIYGLTLSLPKVWPSLLILTDYALYTRKNIIWVVNLFWITEYLSKLQRTHTI